MIPKDISLFEKECSRKSSFNRDLMCRREFSGIGRFFSSSDAETAIIGTRPLSAALVDSTWEEFVFSKERIIFAEVAPFTMGIWTDRQQRMSMTGALHKSYLHVHENNVKEAAFLAISTSTFFAIDG